MSTVAEVAEMIAHSQALALSEFRDMVDAFAANAGYSPDETQRILNCSGKTVDDLTAAVRKKQDRAANLQKLAERAELAAEKLEHDAAIAAANAKLQAAIEEHRRDIGPHQWRIQEISIKLGETSQLEHELFRECPDEELWAQYRHIENEIRRAHAEKNEADRVYHHVRTQRENEAMRRGGNPSQFDAAWERAQKRLEAVKQRQPELVRQRDEIFAAMVRA